MIFEMMIAVIITLYVIAEALSSMSNILTSCYIKDFAKISKAYSIIFYMQSFYICQSSFVYQIT